MKVTKKRGRKRKKPVMDEAMPDSSPQPALPKAQVHDDEQMDDDSDGEIVRIKVESNPSVLPVKKKSKKYKIRLDPSILLDDDMHGGVEFMSSTILKSDSSKADVEMAQEEHIQNDVNMEDDDNTKVIIKTSEADLEISHRKPNTILETDCYLNSKYSKILDRIIRLEFEALEKEAEEFYAKYEKQKLSKKKSKAYKKYFNFSYFLAKRLKTKINSRKFKSLSQLKRGDVSPSQDLLSDKESIDEMQLSPLKRTQSSKLPSQLRLQKKSLSVSSPVIENRRGRKPKLKVIEDEPSLEQIKEEDNEESAKEEMGKTEVKEVKKEVKVEEHKEIKEVKELKKEEFELVDSEMYEQGENLGEIEDIINQKKFSQVLKKEISGNPLLNRKDSQLDLMDSNIMEDEVSKMFMSKKISDNDFFRRQSSISDIKFKRKDSTLSKKSYLKNEVENPNVFMNDILNDDDKDGEEIPEIPKILENIDYPETPKVQGISTIHEISEIKEEKSVVKSLSMKDIPSLERNILENKPVKEEKPISVVKDSVSESGQESVSEGSSMNIDSNSSSSVKEEEGSQTHRDNESDLLNQSPPLKPKKSHKSLKRSQTEVLPSISTKSRSKNLREKILQDTGPPGINDPFKNMDLKDLDDIKIPMKKSVSGMQAQSKKADELNRLVKEHKDIDKIRDKKNKKEIIKHLNMIKVKTYGPSSVDEGSNYQGSQGENKVKCVLHLTESELKIIRKNRNLLLDLGAMLFWDHKYDNIRGDHAYFPHTESLNEKKFEFEITGSHTEVERAKEASIYLLNYERKIEKEQIVVIEIDMWVPKIHIRKVIGYQEKHIIEYYKKFDVTISYDANLINDESYPINEDTMITIKGKKAFAEIVSNDINERVSNLIVKTLHLAPADCKYLKEKI